MPQPMSVPAFWNAYAVKFGWIAHQLGNRQNRQLERYDLTHQQAKILTYLYLYRGKKVSQRDIEEFFSVKASTITSVVGNLERKGFLRRQPDEQDGRRKDLLLTAKGENVQQELIRAFEETERQIAQGLSTEEQESLRQTLDRVCRNLRETGPTARNEERMSML